MKSNYKVAVAMLAGVALGAFVVQGLHAQAKPPIYVVAEIDVSNLDAYLKEYVPVAQAAIKAAGGRILAVGQNITPIEGTRRSALLFNSGKAPSITIPIASRRHSWMLGRSARSTRNSAPLPSRACRNNLRNLPYPYPIRTIGLT